MLLLCSNQVKKFRPINIFLNLKNYQVSDVQSSLPHLPISDKSFLFHIATNLLRFRITTNGKRSMFNTMIFKQYGLKRCGRVVILGFVCFVF